jgi:hypothetical protein
MVKDFSCGVDFNDLTGIHYGHTLAITGGEGDIVGDQQYGQGTLFFQAFQEVKDLFLDRYISAVVGSSAISTVGRLISAMAIATR